MAHADGKTYYEHGLHLSTAIMLRNLLSMGCKNLDSWYIIDELAGEVYADSYEKGGDR